MIANGDFKAADKKEPWPAHWERPKVGVQWVEEKGNHFLRLRAGEPGTTVLVYRSINIPSDAKALRLTWRQASAPA